VLLAHKSLKKLFFCLWGFGGYYLFLALFFNMRDRYMFPAYPFLLLTAGVGATETLRTTSNLLKKTWNRGRERIIEGVLYISIITTLLPQSMELISKHTEDGSLSSMYNWGKDISKRVEPQSVMFARSPHLPFFAGTIFSSVPYASLDKTTRFGQSRGVKYWLASSSYIPRLRPQFLPLLNPRIKHPGLEPVAVYGTDPRNIHIIYKILPAR